MRSSHMAEEEEEEEEESDVGSADDGSDASQSLGSDDDDDDNSDEDDSDGDGVEGDDHRGYLERKGSGHTAAADGTTNTAGQASFVKRTRASTKARARARAAGSLLRRLDRDSAAGELQVGVHHHHNPHLTRPQDSTPLKMLHLTLY